MQAGRRMYVGSKVFKFVPEERVLLSLQEQSFMLYALKRLDWKGRRLEHQALVTSPFNPELKPQP